MNISAPVISFLQHSKIGKVNFCKWHLFVLLTRTFRQKGSSESKQLEGKEEVDEEPDPTKKDAPWPVHKGGLVLKFINIPYQLYSWSYICFHLPCMYMEADWSSTNHN